MAIKNFFQLYRNQDVATSKEQAKTKLTTAVQNLSDKVAETDGMPLLGRYIENGETKSLIGVINNGELSFIGEHATNSDNLGGTAASEYLTKENIKDTTGTSTTDTMSQNAITKESRHIYSDYIFNINRSSNDTEIKTALTPIGLSEYVLPKAGDYINIASIKDFRPSKNLNVFAIVNGYLEIGNNIVIYAKIPDNTIDFLNKNNFTKVDNNCSILLSYTDETKTTFSYIQIYFESTNIPIINISYRDLKYLKTYNDLKPSKQYKITDFVTIVKQSEKYKSANHPFDLIVTAISDTEISPIAHAVPHEGDNYFNDCDLSKWEVWYSFDNDPKYSWCDPNGKGVIYRMIDEYGNDCPYDFKNIMFTRDYNWFNDNTDFAKFMLSDSPTNYNLMFYTFSTLDDSVETNLQNMPVVDLSLNNEANVHFDDQYLLFVPTINNKIESCCIFDPKDDNKDKEKSFILPNNIFIGLLSQMGKFNGTCNNTFVTNSINNTVGNNIVNNYFYSATNIKLGYMCYSNILTNTDSCTIYNIVQCNVKNSISSIVKPNCRICDINLVKVNISAGDRGVSNMIFNLFSTDHYGNNINVYIPRITENTRYKYIIENKSNGKIVKYIAADLIDDSMSIWPEPLILKTTDTQYLGQAIPSLHSAGVISSPDGIKESEMTNYNIGYFKNCNIEYAPGITNTATNESLPMAIWNCSRELSDFMNTVNDKYYPNSDGARQWSYGWNTYGLFFMFIDGVWKNVVSNNTCGAQQSSTYDELLVIGVGNSDWPAKGDQGTPEYVKLYDYLKTI